MAGMQVDEPACSPDSLINAQDAIAYWNSIDSDVTGMLGGYPKVSRIDLLSSGIFLAKLKRRAGVAGKLALAVDCGAGIGRITKGLLLDHCERVEVVEPVQKFTDELIKAAADAGVRDRIPRVHNVGLEHFYPDTTYSLIWNQWCVGHLTDADLVSYFVRCKAALADGGWMVVKENLSSLADGSDDFDALDSSVTRGEIKFNALFEQAGLAVVVKERQRNFPKELLPVMCWALQPKEWLTKKKT